MAVRCRLVELRSRRIQPRPNACVLGLVLCPNDSTLRVLQCVLVAYAFLFEEIDVRLAFLVSRQLLQLTDSCLIEGHLSSIFTTTAICLPSYSPLFAMVPASGTTTASL